MIVYKVMTIMATELLAGTNASTRYCFLVLVVGALVLLVLVIVDRPFKDGSGATGFTGADKAETLALIAMLAGYGCGIWCWQKTSGCELWSGNCAYDDSIELTVVESTLSTIAMVLTSLAPTFYMIYEVRKQRRQRVAAAVAEVLLVEHKEQLVVLKDEIVKIEADIEASI